MVHFMLIVWYNCIHTLLKELYTVFGNLIIVFLPWSAECERQFSSMNSIKTLLRNSLGQENIHDSMLIACDDLLPKEFLPGLLISGWYLVMVVFTWTGTRKEFLNVLMKIKTSNCSVADFDYELAVNMWKEKKACRIYKNESQ